MKFFEGKPEDKRGVLEKLDDAAFSALEKLDDASLAVLEKFESAFDSTLDFADESTDKAMDLVDAIEEKFGDSWVIHKLMVRDARVGLVEMFSLDLSEEREERLFKMREDAISMRDGWQSQIERVKNREGTPPDLTDTEIERYIEQDEAHIQAQNDDIEAIEAELKERGLLE